MIPGRAGRQCSRIMMQVYELQDATQKNVAKRNMETKTVKYVSVSKSAFFLVCVQKLIPGHEDDGLQSR